jgi:tetraacyldisaccharide 4'-kinase
MKVIRIILFPFTFLYGFAVILRNALYDHGILRSTEFGLPVISVGNLAVGGAGKSPMTEYLTELLHRHYKVAILSRGYGRQSKGFYEVEALSPVSMSGDEPLQFKKKFPLITVAVCEDRVEGIRRLQDDHEVILLDDAFQHRAVKPGLSILLFDYSKMTGSQWLLPTGDLREPLWEKRRANCIVVTKCPVNMDEKKKQQLIYRLHGCENRPVFFSSIQYGDLTALSGSIRKLSSLNSDSVIVLLTGIANPTPLVHELEKYTLNLRHHSYPDHHVFTTKNITKLADDFHSFDSGDKMIITTEKDLQRLKSPTLELLNDLPVYFLPIKAGFNDQESGAFDSLILKYVTKHLFNH